MPCHTTVYCAHATRQREGEGERDRERLCLHSHRSVCTLESISRLSVPLICCMYRFQTNICCRSKASLARRIVAHYSHRTDRSISYRWATQFAKCACVRTQSAATMSCLRLNFIPNSARPVQWPSISCVCHLFRLFFPFFFELD